MGANLLGVPKNASRALGGMLILCEGGYDGMRILAEGGSSRDRMCSRLLPLVPCLSCVFPAHERCHGTADCRRSTLVAESKCEVGMNIEGGERCEETRNVSG